MKLLKQTKI